MKYTSEYFIVLAITLWFIFYNAVFTPAFLAAHKYGGDIYFYYTGNGPDGNPLPYPSLAFAYFDIIHIFSSDAASFSYVFEFLSIVWFALIFFLYSKTNGRSNLVKIFFIFAPVFFLIPIRLEIVPIMLSFFGVYLFTSGKKMAGWLLVIAAVFIKIFPVVLLPLFLLLEMKNFRKNLPRIALAVLFGVALFFLAFETNMNAVIYNAERGIEMESTHAGILFMINSLNPIGISIDYNYGSHNLALPPPIAFLPQLTFVLQALSLLSILFLFHRDDKKEKKIWRYVFLLIAATIFFGKIFSPQFVLWPIAFAVVLIKDEKLKALYPLCIMLAILSLLVFPFLLDALVGMETTAALVLNLRNAVLGAMLGYVYLKSGTP